MHRGRFIFAAALMLAAASARAAAPSILIDDADFTLQDRTRAPIEWRTNGTAGLALDPTSAVPVSLALIHNLNGEQGTAWSLIRGTVPSFTMWADVNVTFDTDITKGCPADGFTMAFADTTPDAVGQGGGSLALYSTPKTIPSFVAFEVNLWHDNALEDTKICTTGKFLTFEFTDANKATGVDRTVGTPDKGGARLAQVTAPATLTILNGGWYRYQWNVDTVAGTMAAFITGLQDSNKAVQNMPLTNVTLGANAPKINFAGRWGITAATGGAHAGVNVARVRIVTPMAAPGSLTAGE